MREGRVDVLAHLVAGAGQRDRAVAADRDPGVGLEEASLALRRARRPRRAACARRERLGARVLPDLAADDEPAADERS